MRDIAIHCTINLQFVQRVLTTRSIPTTPRRLHVYTACIDGIHELSVCNIVGWHTSGTKGHRWADPRFSTWEFVQETAAFVHNCADVMIMSCSNIAKLTSAVPTCVRAKWCPGKNTYRWRRFSNATRSRSLCISWPVLSSSSRSRTAFKGGKGSVVRS